MYIDYMRRGFRLFKFCIDTDTNTNKGIYSDYCKFSSPDICICGHIFSSDGSNIRHMCCYCEGSKTGKSLDYEIQRLSLELSINDSWLVYGFSIALSILYKTEWWKL